MNPGSIAAGAPGRPYRDRSIGLTVFGIVLILAGLLCALFVPLMFLSLAMAPKTGQAVEPSMMVPAALLYLILAVAFVWIGAGSILARRWARALVLILAWPWMITGVFTVGLMAIVFPQVLPETTAGGPAIPEDLLNVVIVLVLVVLTLVSVVVPGLLILFYRSPSVAATCESRNPRPAWTDACPLPVLGLSLWLGIGAVFTLPALVAYNSVVPFFGTLLSGPSGVVALLGMTALWAWCAWATYRLRPAGWWVTLIGSLAMTASGLVTFLRMDLLDIYRKMGFPEEQIGELQRSGPMFNGPVLAALSAAFSVALVAWMISVKRHFRSSRI